jgi:hypothetical protein
VADARRRRAAATAEVLECDGKALLALSPKALVVQPLDGVVERRQLVAATIWHLQRVKDGLGPVSAQGDRVVGVLDQPKLDRVGDGPSSYGSFGARLVRRLHPQGLRHERRCSLVERAALAGDLEHDLHSTEPSSPSGVVMLQGVSPLELEDSCCKSEHCAACGSP